MNHLRPINQLPTHEVDNMPPYMGNQDLWKEPKIPAKVEVSLFNQGSKPFIDKNVNLTKEKRGFNHKSWILPYEN